jgi:hypothetical protein
MKTALFSIVFLALPASVVAQAVCANATSEVIEHKVGFTIHGVTLPTVHGSVNAMAAIPDSPKPTHATVFSFWTLIGSEPHQSVDMMPLAIELTKQVGRPWSLSANSPGPMSTRA